MMAGLATRVMLFFIVCFIAAVVISFGLVFLIVAVPIGLGSYIGIKIYRDRYITNTKAQIEAALSPTAVRAKFTQHFIGSDVPIPDDAQNDALRYLENLSNAALLDFSRTIGENLWRKDTKFSVKKEWLQEYASDVRVAAVIHDRLIEQVCTIMLHVHSPMPQGLAYYQQSTTDATEIITNSIRSCISDVSFENIVAYYDSVLSPEEMRRACRFDGHLAAAPLDLSSDVRFEHQWVVAPSGTGKTTLLQTQITEDLERVRRGECSIIVIDSQNQLIPKIARLKLFAPGQPLEGKLTVIEPDPDYPPALNVLDIGLSGLSTRDRYRMQAEALENIKSCLSTMADTQDDMLSYIVELCFVIPGATIQTIVDILKPNGIDAYQKYLDDVDQTCRDYFETTFTPRSQGTNVTKEALTRRLMGMLRNPTFRRMFLNERGTFNMAKELEKPRVILINTDLEFLRHDACQLFGRFFIAQLLQAAEMRGESSLPVFCYIDECQDYIANDDNAAKLMDKARKRKVGMIFAHQRLQNIESANVRDALANVGVRFAGGNETDANYLSRIFRCEPEFVAQKNRGTFACFVRRQTQQAIEVRVPSDALESMPRMTDAEYATIRAEMRARYAAPAQERTVRTPAEPQEQAVARPDRKIPTPAPRPSDANPPESLRMARARKAKPTDPDAGDRTRPIGNWEP
jgi:hypothetical protein